MTAEKACFEAEFPVGNAKPLRVVELPRIPTRDADYVEIFRCVALAYSILPSDLVGKGRSKAIAEARIVTYWLMRQLTRLSYPEIGVAMRKNHTSAMSGARRCLQLRDASREFEAFTDELERAVRARMEGHL